jgi:CubicO group peptidase (beta-lactamase class C family)
MKFKFLTFLILLFFILNCKTVISQHTSKANTIDSLLSNYLKDEIFNGVALVAEKGEILVHKSYGVSDFQNQIPLKLTDRFYIGSLTKQFTSALIFLLQEKGFLRLEDSLSKFLPEFETAEYRQITIHQLLTHTSGLDNYNSFPDFDLTKNYSEQEFITFIQKPLLFLPGSQWNYSNTGYYLLGIIAQRITHQTYGELLKTLIFDPLDMKNSGYDTTWLQKDIAKGFYNTIHGILPHPNYSLSTLISSGGIYSTAEDLFKWDQALYTTELLSDHSKNILFSPIKNDYACGWYVKKGIDEENQVYERHFHGGWIKGYHAFILRRIPSKQVVILLDNSYSQEIQTIKNRIWSALIEEEVKTIKPKISKILFEACERHQLEELIDSISFNLEKIKNQYTLEEFDINTVAYRLMEEERYEEANVLFIFNILCFPLSWNVYDSLGELRMLQKRQAEAKILYEKSLSIHPENVSAKIALEEIKQELKTLQNQ